MNTNTMPCFDCGNQVNEDKHEYEDDIYCSYCIQKYLPQQQGDIILKPVNTLPKNAVRQQPKERGFVLAEGEATGHAHAFALNSGVELWQDGEELYLNVPLDIVEQARALLHEEHKIQPLRKGVYKVEKVQEYDYDTQAAKNIAD